MAVGVAPNLGSNVKALTQLERIEAKQRLRREVPNKLHPRTVMSAAGPGDAKNKAGNRPEKTAAIRGMKQELKLRRHPELEAKSGVHQKLHILGRKDYRLLPNTGLLQ